MGTVVEATFCIHRVPDNELVEDAYGWICPKCFCLIYPFGSEPWAPDDEDDDYSDIGEEW